MESKKNEFVIFVSGSTPTENLGQSIVAAFSDKTEVFVRCIGANAGWQALKGIIVARSLSVAKGVDFDIMPYFKDVILSEKQVTAVEFCLKLKR